MTGLSLNFAAMRSILEGDSGDGVTQRVERWAIRRLSGVLQIETLWRFNAKYEPRWLPRYIVFDSAEQFVPVAVQIMRAESLTEVPVIGRLLTTGVAKRTGPAVPEEVVAAMDTEDGPPGARKEADQQVTGSLGRSGHDDHHEPRPNARPSSPACTWASSVSTIQGTRPLTVPIWYAYEPGGTVDFITGRGCDEGPPPAGGRCLLVVCPIRGPAVRLRQRRRPGQLGGGPGRSRGAARLGLPLPRARGRRGVHGRDGRRRPKTSCSA